MSESESDSEPGAASEPANFVRRHRRKLAGGGIAILLYAVLGFLVLPWAIEKMAVDTVKEQLGADLRVEKLAINPFALSARVDGLEFDGPDGEPVARAGTIYANFELSSLFRWAWSFREIRFDAPELFLARDGDGNLNVEALAEPAGSEPPVAEEEASPTPRLFVRQFAVNDARVNWSDQVPPEPVETYLGPVSVAIVELNTLPERPGEQIVVIATESQGTLTWAGSLQFNPLVSVGRASVQDSTFPMMSAYFRHEIGFDIVDGSAGAQLDYSVTTDLEGLLRVAIENIEVEFTDLRVSTFHESFPVVDEPREFLTVPRIALSGGTLRWPEQEVSLKDFSIDGATLDLLRLESGNLDFALLEESAASGPADAEAEPATSPDPASDWQASLDRFAINDFSLNVLDRSVAPAAETGIREFDLELLNISNTEGASFPTRLSLAALHGGTVQLDGAIVVLPEPEAEFDLIVDELSLEGAHPYLQPQFDVSLDSGHINIDGSLKHNPGELFALDADLEIVDFLITETVEGTRLGSWSSLFVDQLVVSAEESRLEISEIRLTEPYGDIRIAADGSVNLGRITRTNPDAEGGEESAADDATEASAEAPYHATIGRVTIDAGAADFVDESLPLPFAAKINNLEGALTTISTDSAEPSTVELEGAVDEFGLVRISGVVTPLEVARNTNLDVVFENVDVPKFSAYSIPFAGREIASGRLDLDLGYQVADGSLQGENKIVLREFELGEKVPHPDAASLPLGLAVALLKDSSGKIDIDLPVRGDLNDPEFGYWSVIGKAVVNLVVKVATSPFALLGNLVGVEADELEYINFPPGRADLAPPEIERATKLAEALALRPVLRLEISGVIDREVDTLALRKMRVEERIEERATTETGEEDEAGYARRRFEAIEALYMEMSGDTENTIKAVRDGFTTTAVDEDTGEEAAQFDELAYTTELQNRLAENEPITEEALVELARLRAENTHAAVIEADPALDARISIVDLREEESDKDAESVRMKVSLSAGEGGPSEAQPAEQDP